jgi:predicted transcriptional regulator
MANVKYDPLSDRLRCEICGEWFKGLGYHVRHAHKMTANEYKEMFGLDKKTPLMSKGLLALKREQVIESGAYKNLELGAKQRERVKSGKSKIWEYERSLETKERLRRIKSEWFKKRKVEKKRSK